MKSTELNAQKPRQSYESLFRRFLKEANKIKSKSLKEITKKSISTIDTPIYASIIYSETGSMEKVYLGHKLILEEAKFILFLDYYYETGLNKYWKRAELIHKKLLGRLSPIEKRKLLNLEKRLFTFWQLEKDLSEKMKANKTIEIKEIEKFTLKKSRDVFLYFLIATFIAPIQKKIIHQLYHRQLLRDFEDDCRDLMEDLKQKMPNPLILRLYQEELIDPEKVYSQKKLEKLGKSSGIFSSHKRYIKEYIRTH